MKIEFVANGSGGERDEFPVRTVSLESNIANVAFHMYTYSGKSSFILLSVSHKYWTCGVLFAPFYVCLGVGNCAKSLSVNLFVDSFFNP